MYLIKERRGEFLNKIGYVVFEPTSTWEIDNSIVNRCEHSIKFFRNNSKFRATMGRFEMIAIISEELELGGLEFTTKYVPDLKIHFCYMIVKHAIIQAKSIDAKRLIMDTSDPMFLEVFLDYGFKIRTMSVIVDQEITYSATKEMKGEKKNEKSTSKILK